MSPSTLADSALNGRAHDVWELHHATARELTLAEREKLCSSIRPLLHGRLAADPTATGAAFTTAYGTVRATRRGTSPPGAPLKLVVAAARDPRQERKRESGGTLLHIELPSETLAAEGAALVPCGDLRERIAALFAIRGGNALAAWSRATGATVPPALRHHLTSSPPLLLLVGAPGAGKTVHARVGADDYCRAAGTGGTLLQAAVDRGDGTVGSLSSRIHEMFDALEGLPADRFRMLLVDEAEALVPVRLGHAMHHEDLSGVDVFLERLDRLASEQFTFVALTSNLRRAIDPAVCRRATVIAVERPGQRGIAALLASWLPEWEPETLSKHARHAAGMTFADVHRAMLGVFMECIRNGTAVTPQLVAASLRRGERTRSLE